MLSAAFRRMPGRASRSEDRIFVYSFTRSPAGSYRGCMFSRAFTDCIATTNS
jgi:hypothetical protein